MPTSIEATGILNDTSKSVQEEDRRMMAIMIRSRSPDDEGAVRNFVTVCAPTATHRVQLAGILGTKDASLLNSVCRIRTSTAWDSKRIGWEWVSK